MDQQRIVELLFSGPSGEAIAVGFLVTSYLRFRTDWWKKVPERIRWSVPLVLTTATTVLVGMADSVPWETIVQQALGAWIVAMGIGGFVNGIVDPSKKDPPGNGTVTRIHMNPPEPTDRDTPVAFMALLLGALAIGCSTPVPKAPLRATANLAQAVVDRSTAEQRDGASRALMRILAELSQEDPDPAVICAGFREVLPVIRAVTSTLDEPERTYSGLVVLAVDLTLGSGVCK